MDIDAGRFTTCGIREPGTLWCWGDIKHHEYSDGGHTEYWIPVQIGSETDWTAVSSGYGHTCGIRGSGSTASAWCWGNNDRGQLGTGEVLVRGDLVEDPVEVGGGFVSGWTDIDVGYAHTCGIRQVVPQPFNNVYCWGAGDNGQLAGGSNADKNWPGAIGALHDWTKLTTGYAHTCAIRKVDGDRSLWCWGDNDEGQLGLGDTDDRNVAVRVGTGTNWSEVSAGSHTCGIRGGIEGGPLFCWGSNGVGQLGNGTRTNTAHPTEVSLQGDWVSVSAGSDFTLARRDNP